MPYPSDAANDIFFKGGIIGIRKGEELFSGKLQKIRRQRDRKTAADLIVFKGFTDEYELKGRVAHPSPTDGDFTTQARDEQEGPGETLLKYYFNINAGPGALADRQIPGFTVEADAASGSNVKIGARMNVLLEFLQSIAIKGGVSFRIVDGEFQVYVPQDLSDKIKFTLGLGNLVGFSYDVNAPKANHIYVGGGGVGVARVFVERQDSQSVIDFGRFEEFRDRRDTSDVTELTQTGDEELEKARSNTSTSVKTDDIAGIEFQEDYNLGDKVKAIIDDNTVIEVVQEVVIKIDKNGEIINPVLGVDGTRTDDPLANIYKKRSDLDSRIRTLETE